MPGTRPRISVPAWSTHTNHTAVVAPRERLAGASGRCRRSGGLGRLHSIGSSSASRAALDVEHRLGQLSECRAYLPMMQDVDVAAVFDEFGRRPATPGRARHRKPARWSERSGRSWLSHADPPTRRCGGSTAGPSDRRHPRPRCRATPDHRGATDVPSLRGHLPAPPVVMSGEPAPGYATLKVEAKRGHQPWVRGPQRRRTSWEPCRPSPC